MGIKIEKGEEMRVTDTQISFTSEMKVPVVLIEPEEYYRKKGVKFTNKHNDESYANGFRVSEEYAKKWINGYEIDTANEDGVIVEHNGELVYVRKTEAEKLGLEEVPLKKVYKDGEIGVFWEVA